MSFDPFEDFNTRGYLRNFDGSKDLARVKINEHIAFQTNLTEALALLKSKTTINYSDFLQTHKTLFGSLYPWAGEDRSANAPNIAIAKAGRSNMFAHPKAIRRAADYALQRGQDIEFMRSHPGDVMGLLAHAHPFLDGNGRTIMVLHCDMARRAHLGIKWANVERNAYLAALTRELESPAKDELDLFLKPYLLFDGDADAYSLALNSLRLFAK